MINSVNPDHLKGTRNTIPVRNGKRISATGPTVRRTPKVPNKRIIDEPVSHGRKLMPEKDLIKMAMGRMGNEIK